MASSYQLYNVTLKDYCPMFQYSPSRNGSIQTTWRSISEDDQQAEWFATYNIGASMRLEWIGTDVLLYGFGNQTSYLMLSDSEPNATSVAPTGVEGLLYKQTGLQYGSHWIGLQTIGAPVAIVSAIVTVGMGEPGTSLYNRTLPTVIDRDQLNPFFSTSNFVDWSVVPNPNIAQSPTLVTRGASAKLTFDINSTVAFAMFGTLGVDAGPFSVTITPPPPHAEETTASDLDAFTTFNDTGDLMYISTGLLRTQNYTVTVTNGYYGDILAVEKIILFDTLTSPSPSSSSTSSSVVSSSFPTQSVAESLSRARTLSVGAITGIAIGGGLALLAAVILFIAVSRRRRRNNIVEIEPTDSRVREPDIQLPPEAGYAYHSVASLHEGELPGAVQLPYTKSYAESSGSIVAGDRRSPFSPNTSNSEMKRHAGSPLAFSSTTMRSSTSVSADVDSIVREQDAGRIPTSEPPLYDPAWNDDDRYRENDG